MNLQDKIYKKRDDKQLESDNMSVTRDKTINRDGYIEIEEIVAEEMKPTFPKSIIICILVFSICFFSFTFVKRHLDKKYKNNSIELQDNTSYKKVKEMKKEK